MLTRSCAGDQAHLRSDSGPGVGAVFHGSPAGPEFQVQPMHFRTLVLERLRLPLLLTEARCEGGGQNDIFGRHRAACPHSGLSKRRAGPTDRTLARVCREAGATVTRNVKLRDMNVQVSATDEREIEVVAAGLPIHHGAQLVVDITLHSAVTSVGAPRATVATVNGAALSQARRDKEAKYAELVTSERCRLVVVALKVEHGGFGVRGRHGIFSHKRRTTGAATLSVSGLAEEVDKDVVSLVCQGIRDFAGCESYRRLGRR